MSDPQLAAKLFRGFGDVSRLRVLEALRDGPQCVGAIVERTGLTQPNVSMHLACLAECGLVTRERRGKFVDYAIADKRVVRVLDGIDELLLQVGHLIAACPRYREPARQRKTIPDKRQQR
jgi:ArsR family transcriptional regulator, cadmium/lead-responsive transcriptional repressor